MGLESQRPEDHVGCGQCELHPGMVADKEVQHIGPQAVQVQLRCQIRAGAGMRLLEAMKQADMLAKFLRVKRFPHQALSVQSLCVNSLIACSPAQQAPVSACRSRLGDVCCCEYIRRCCSLWGCGGSHR